jgi:hypothetical protein
VRLVSTTAFLFASWHFPLLGTLSPDSGTLAALTLGIPGGWLSAAWSSRKHEGGYLRDLLGPATLLTAVWFVVAVILAIKGHFSPSCNDDGGLLPFVVTSIPPICLHSALGVWCGRVVGRAVWAWLVCFFVQAIAAAWLLWGLWQEPGFRVASHLYVVLTSDLLRGAALPIAAMQFRAATMALAATIAFLGALAMPPLRRSGLATFTERRSTWVVGAAACAGLAWWLHAMAAPMLHTSRTTLEHDYSLVVQRNNVVIHADPLLTTIEQATALAAESALWLQRLQTRLGPLSDAPIHVFAHASGVQRAQYTGAQHVDFTLPWRREIHIAGNQVPHPTLGHELAHVAAGERSDQLLRIPSKFGVLQGAAIVEGVAMALTPELAAEGGLTLREQAAAMVQFGRKPNLQALFGGMSFFGEESARAYVAAGAVIESVIARAGADAPRVMERLYRGAGSLADAIDGDVDAFLHAHQQELATWPLPADAAAVVERRFQQSSILHRICAVDEDAFVQRTRAHYRSHGSINLSDVRNEAMAAHEDTAAANMMVHEAVVVLRDDALQSGDNHTLWQLLQADIDLAASPAARAQAQLQMALHLGAQGQARAAEGVLLAIEPHRLNPDEQRTAVATRWLVQELLRMGTDAAPARAALQFLSRPGEATRAALWVSGIDDLDDASEGATSNTSKSVQALLQYLQARQLLAVGATASAIRLLRLATNDNALPPPFDEQALWLLSQAWVRQASVGGPDRRAEATRLLQQLSKEATRPATRMMLRDAAERAQLSSSLAHPGDAFLLGVGTR